MEGNLVGTEGIKAINEKIQKESAFVDLLTMEMQKVIVGQNYMVERLLIGLLANGHILLEGVPGLAKTLAINTLSQAIDADFSRVQFTPDLLPADVIGTMIFNQKKDEFTVKRGPIFANFVLADEINRAPAKVQSALLEAMQERQVTLGDTTYKLPEPFLVLATQNPIEQEGTYPLPEAQLDRFMFMIKLEYPTMEEELDIIKQTTSSEEKTIEKVISKEQILSFQRLIKKIPVADNVFEYIVKLVHKTRPFTDHSSSVSNEYLEWGAGPRASQFLVQAAKCNALLKGKYSPDIEDVKEIAQPVLVHRIVRNFKAETEGKTEEILIKELL